MKIELLTLYQIQCVINLLQLKSRNTIIFFE